MTQKPTPGFRVLHVAQPTSEGTATVVRDLVDLGVREGHEVTVACPAEGPLREWVRSRGATWVELPLQRPVGLADVGHMMQLRRLLGGFDLVHLHSSKAGALGRIAALTRRGSPPVIFVPHGWSWLVGGRLAVMYKALERSLSRQPRAIVAVSEEEYAVGRAVLGDACSLVVIENGVDLERFTPTGERAARGAQPLVVCVGRLTRQKGQDLAIRALARMTDETAQLRLVGGGPDRAQLEQLAGRLGVLERVELVGAADPSPHLRSADLVVLPSRWEGLALALLEAMAVGCAIVASDQGSRRALGDAGTVISVADETAFVEELAAVLDALLTDPAVRAQMQGRARARAVDSYSTERTREDYRRLWRSVTAPG